MNPRLFPPMKTILTLTLLALAIDSRATLTEPDNLIYGNITLDNALITSARTDVVIEARRTTNGPAIASYRMGSEAAFGDFYALRLAIESLTPVSDPNASQVTDDLFIVVTDSSGMRAQSSFTIMDRGVAQRIDFGVTTLDSDGDGLPDAWELQRFGGLGQTPGSISPNGLTALDNFVAGTDPNDPNGGFRLAITHTNNQKTVSFVARRAQGPGYDGMTRRYTLESSTAAGGGAWAGVPGFTDVAGDDQTVGYSPSDLGGPGFFRGRVSLEGFVLPGANGDGDGDGLPDAWENLHFGNLNQTGTSINLNGQFASFNYVAGNDPNDPNNRFQLNAANSSGQKQFSFLALQAAGPGYEGKSRHYALEYSTDLHTWFGVANFTDLLGANQTVTYLSPGTGPGTFFRSRVWLEP
jgi:hypothetical protein